jgi:predicted nuclease of predicted toxin-antitoxin system
MKLIVDAHLPKSICEYFYNCDCIHTQQLEKGNLTKDSLINKLSIKEHRIVITKDTDFYYSYIASRKPYKLVLVKLGNMRLGELKNYFKTNSEKILTILKNHSFIILEKNKIKIIE